MLEEKLQALVAMLHCKRKTMEPKNASMKSYLAFEPTNEQAKALEMCENLLNNNGQDFLIIRGSAGTGKSSIINAITSFLFETNQKFVLGAPTVKACHIIQSKTGYQAKTIHSIAFETKESDGELKLFRKLNAEPKKTVFIIDEASMISDVITLNSERFKTNRPVLSGFLEYVKQGNSENKIIFIGDHYQLPPIDGSGKSVALSKEYLCNHKNLKGEMIALTEVKRQQKDSYILSIANQLRNCLDNNSLFEKLTCKYLFNSSAALNTYLNLYQQSSFNKVSIVASTNKDVNWFNNAIRQRLGYSNASIAKGDQVSIENNWFGASKLILKGQNGIVNQVGETIETFAGLKFIETEIDFYDNVNEKQTVKSFIMLDSLLNESDEIKTAKNKNLTHEVFKYNKTFQQTKNITDDKYLSAMQLKFAYATTCHKAQGSEWENVILHPFYNKSDYRWLYTAVTRAAKELYTY